MNSANSTSASLQHMLSNRSTALRKTDIPSIAIYFCQLIAHDIVPATRPNSLARPASKVSSALNLDSIYDDESASYDAQTGLFDYTQLTSQHTGNIGYDFQRCIDSEGKSIAQIPDIRNDENIIISQLAIFWMRLNNCLIENFNNSKQEARKNVQILFQWICVECVFPLLFDRKKYDYFFTSSAPPKIPDYLTLKQEVPSFFSQGAFRFGHSMIRHQYNVHFKDSAKSAVRTLLTPDIFNKHRPLNSKHFLDFEVFVHRNSATALDTRIIAEMGAIGEKKVNIVDRNITASASIDGYLLHKALNDKYDYLGLGQPLSPEESSTIEHTTKPLWFYVLEESEKVAKGKTLGPFGSALNLAVLYGSIANTNTGLVSDQKGYSSTLGDELFKQVAGVDSNTLSELKQEDNKRALFSTLFKMVKQKES